MNNTQKNVSYAKFKLDNLFNIRYGKFIPKRKAGTKVPFITTRSGNNGIAYYVDSKPMSQGDALTIASDGSVGEVYYQDKPFSASNIVVIMEPHSNIKAKWSPQSALYIAASIKRYAQTQFDWSHKYSVNRVRATELILPVTSSGTPDFEYMEERIRELEEERIRELEAYLNVTGLSDATLTKAEQDALDKMNNGVVKWKKFKIDSILDAPGKGDVDLQNSDIDGKGEFFINSGSTNYGIKGRISRKAQIFNANTLTIDFFGNVYYRDFKYKLATHNHVFSFSSKYLKSKEIGLFFASSLSFLKKQFAYNNMLTWNKIKNLDMLLPVTPSGDIDFDFMENYITAIEKQSIKGVIEYKDKIIQTTKDVVNAN